MKAQVSLDDKQLERAASFIVNGFNEGQRDGFTIDEMLAVMSYILGAALKQRGVVLDVERPMCEVLPPVAQGYEDAKPAEAWQIDAMKGLGLSD